MRALKKEVCFSGKNGNTKQKRYFTMRSGEISFFKDGILNIFFERKEQI